MALNLRSHDERICSRVFSNTNMGWICYGVCVCLVAGIYCGLL